MASSTLILHQIPSVIFHWVLHVTQWFGLWSVVWISSFVADSQHKFIPPLLQALFFACQNNLFSCCKICCQFFFLSSSTTVLVQIPRSKIQTIQAIVALLLLFSYEHKASLYQNCLIHYNKIWLVLLLQTIIAHGMCEVKLTGFIHHNVKILYAFVVPIPRILQFDISLWQISNFLHIALSQTNVKS